MWLQAFKRMENFVLIAVCIAAGMALKASRLLPTDAHKGINAWVLYVALPAVSFKYLPHTQWTSQMLFPVLSPAIVLLGSVAYMRLFGHYKKHSEYEMSTLKLASGFSNTSFVGFPLVVAYFGEQYLNIAVICDQAMFALLSSAGVLIAINGNPGNGGGHATPGMIIKRLITFPPFVGCVAALTLGNLIDLNFAAPVFSKLAATIAPLALFSVGLQLDFKGWQKEVPDLSVTLLYKLLLAPALVLGVAIVLGIQKEIAWICIFEAAMPTVITSTIIAEQFGLNYRYINMAIGISIVVGFATTALWYLVLTLPAVTGWLG